MSGPGSAWKALLARTRDAFTSPSFTLFCSLIEAWVCCPARRTICSMVAVMDPATRSAHDAYHRLVRCGVWSMEALWSATVAKVIARLGPDGPIVCYLDDTLFHRPGPNVNGAGSFRDAVRSTRSHIVYAWGLNLVVLAVRVVPPWGGMPVAVPVGVRLHRKGGTTLGALGAELMVELAARAPERRFVLCADGAYAHLAGDNLPRTTVVSRMRRDAALFGPPPPPTGKRGRPRTRGDRLPTPPKLAALLRRYATVEIEWRGRHVTKQVWARPVLWYRVCPTAMVVLVVVRDPTGHEPDDFFFSTDLAMSAAEVVSIYAGRWSIEVTYRDVKQLVGGEQPQTWKGDGPERAASLSFWVHGAVWLWYLDICGDHPILTTQAWNTNKTTASALDALAALRRVLWRQRISARSEAGPLSTEMTEVLIEALATAA